MDGTMILVQLFILFNVSVVFSTWKEGSLLDKLNEKLGGGGVGGLGGIGGVGGIGGLRPGRPQHGRPQHIEHNYCNIMFAEQVDYAKSIDRRANAQAYKDGDTLCRTNCRIVTRGNTKVLGAVPSPDFIQCGAGNQYCFEGNCYGDKDLVELVKKNRITTP